MSEEINKDETKLTAENFMNLVNKLNDEYFDRTESQLMIPKNIIDTWRKDSYKYFVAESGTIKESETPISCTLKINKNEYNGNQNGG